MKLVSQNVNTIGYPRLVFKFLLVVVVIVWGLSGTDTDPAGHDFSSFPLSGPHAEIECSECHSTTDRNDDNPRSECVSCHLPEFHSAENPDHIARNFPIDNCSDCHSQLSWQISSFTHETGFEACAVCHSQELSAANNLVSGHARLPNSCTTCHSQQNWQQVNFDHNALNIPIEPGRDITNCQTCHVDGFNFQDEVNYEPQR